MIISRGWGNPRIILRARGGGVEATKSLARVAGKYPPFGAHKFMENMNKRCSTAGFAFLLDAAF